MDKRILTRREFMRLAGLGAAGAVVASCAPTSEPAPAPASPTPPEAVEEVEVEEATVEAMATPASWGPGPILTYPPPSMDVDGADEIPTQMVCYNSPAEYPGDIPVYYEAPELAVMVQNGELPPVEERLPTNPIVVEPEESVGRYGGHITSPVRQDRAIGAVLNGRLLQEPLTLCHWSDAKETVPNVVESWELAEDGKTCTLYIREGIKWSDGEPFTADDVMFWWEDRAMNDELSPTKSGIFYRGGQLIELTKIDDLTVEFSYAEPYTMFHTYLGRWTGPKEVATGSPKHYLSQFHADYADAKALQEKMDEEGFEVWMDLFAHKADVGNPERPTLAPWVIEQRPPAPVQLYRRNPYCIKVDTAGNQLPYAELKGIRLADDEAITLKIIAGELDYGDVPIKDIPLAQRNQESGDYRFCTTDWMANALCNIIFNYSIEDPVKRELYNDKRFRQALSVAIDREELIQLYWQRGVWATQVAPAPGDPWHGERDMFKKYTQYDPDLANQWLDDIGLTERDSEGYRLGLDGERLEVTLYPNLGWPPECAEVMETVKGYWTDIGFRINVKPEANELWYSRHRGGLHDMSCRGAHFAGGEVHPTLNSNFYAGSGWQWAPEWARWLDTGGEEGVEPPEDVKRVRALRDEILGEPDEEKQLEMVDEVFEIHTENIWSIGVVSTIPMYDHWKAVKNRIRNVPTRMVTSYLLPSVPAQWFINEEG